MKKNHLTFVVGASLLPLTINVAIAETNPFALSELSSAYMQTAEATPDNSAGKMKEGSCGEGKCGAAMMKKSPSSEKKAYEAKCAGNKPSATTSTNSSQTTAPGANTQK